MDKITVRKGNELLKIKAEDKKYYMDRGYSVINAETGEVLEEAMSRDVASLQLLVTQLRAENAQLKAALENKSKPGPKKKQE